LTVDPTSWMLTHDGLADLVEGEDEECEGDWCKVPQGLQWVRVENGIHARSVDKEDGEDVFENPAKDERSVVDTLLENR